MSKKLLSLVLVLGFALTLSACNTTTEEETTPAADDTTMMEGGVSVEATVDAE